MNIDWTTWAGQGRLSDYDEMRTAASFVMPPSPPGQIILFGHKRFF